MCAMASQITNLTIVYSTFYSGTDQRKHQSSASLAFVRGIHRWPVNSPHKGPVTRKMFPFDDVVMRFINAYTFPGTMTLLSLLFTVISPSTSLFLIIATLGCLCVWHSGKSRGLPPGPPSLPLIGSLLSLRGNDVREELCRLARHYGDVFTMDMGINRTVILASYDAIREALIQNAQALSGRPSDMFVFEEITEGKGNT